jgi:transposase InsO family protein
MTDNGRATDPSSRRGLSSAGDPELFTQPYRTKTSGKAERFIRTLLGDWAYAADYPTSAARTRALPVFSDRYNHTPTLSLDPPFRWVWGGFRGVAAG